MQFTCSQPKVHFNIQLVFLMALKVCGLQKNWMLVFLSSFAVTEKLEQHSTKQEFVSLIDFAEVISSCFT
jgi:hypothetical protein